MRAILFFIYVVTFFNLASASPLGLMVSSGKINISPSQMRIVMVEELERLNAFLTANPVPQNPLVFPRYQKLNDGSLSFELHALFFRLEPIYVKNSDYYLIEEINENQVQLINSSGIIFGDQFQDQILNEYLNFLNYDLERTFHFFGPGRIEIRVKDVSFTLGNNYYGHTFDSYYDHLVLGKASCGSIF